MWAKFSINRLLICIFILNYADWRCDRASLEWYETRQRPCSISRGARGRRRRRRGKLLNRGREVIERDVSNYTRAILIWYMSTMPVIDERSGLLQKGWINCFWRCAVQLQGASSLEPKYVYYHRRAQQLDYISNDSCDLHLNYKW